MTKAPFYSLLALLGLCAAPALHADYFGDVYVEPLGIVAPFDGPAVGFEWAIPYNDSLRLQAHFNGRGDYPAPAESRNVMGLEAGMRFYFSETRQMRGFFLGPQLGIGFQNDVYTDANGKQNTLASGTYYKAGLEFGHQWILGRGFVLTPAVSSYFVPGYAVGTGRPSENGRIYAGIELNLGWAFSR